MVGGGEVVLRGDGVLGEFEGYLFYGRYVVGILHNRTLYTIAMYQDILSDKERLKMNDVGIKECRSRMTERVSFRSPISGSPLPCHEATECSPSDPCGQKFRYRRPCR